VRNTRRYLSSFTLTGHNLGQSDLARREDELLQSLLPTWVVRYGGPLNITRLILKVASGAYFERPPLRYAIYAFGADQRRVTFQAQYLSQKWPQS